MKFRLITMQNWFILKSGLVTGPFTSENVLSTYTNQNVMVWGLNCAEWLDFSEWQNQLQNGSFDNEEQSAKIFIKPKKKETNDSNSNEKVFKIRPMTTPEQDEMTNVDSLDSDNSSDNSVDTKVQSVNTKNLTSFEKTAVAPLPNIPSVDDIFSSENQNSNDQNSADQITQLDGQLKDLLTEDDFGSDGKTLVQATMDGMAEELMNGDGATQVQNIDMNSFESEVLEESIDGATQVQSFDMNSLESEVSEEPIDGATQVQSFDMSSLESEVSEEQIDGATQVQSFDMNSLESDVSEEPIDGATEVQSFDMNSLESDVSEEPIDGATEAQSFDMNSLESDVSEEPINGATEVQSFDMNSLESDVSEEPIDGATQVQSFDMNSLESEVSEEPIDGATEVQSFDMNSLESDVSEEPIDGATQVQSFDMNSLESEVSEEPIDGATEVQSFDMNSLESDFSEEPIDGATQVQSFDINSLESEDSDLLASQDDLHNFNTPENLNTDLPDINEIKDHEEQEALNMSNSDNHDPVEKTNVAELKDLAQSIEQKKILENPIWYVAYNGVSEGPMNVEALLKKLDAFEHKDFIYLWKKGFADWQNLFDTPQISSQLGIGFRRHDRLPFSGTVKIEFNGNIQIGQLENLSLSGLGATGFGPLVLGEKVKVTLDCPDLEREVEFTAMIRFTSDLGVLGLSYVSAEYAENVNKVIELVKSFSLNKQAA